MADISALTACAALTFLDLGNGVGQTVYGVGALQQAIGTGLVIQR